MSPLTGTVCGRPVLCAQPQPLSNFIVFLMSCCCQALTSALRGSCIHEMLPKSPLLCKSCTPYFEHAIQLIIRSVFLSLSRLRGLENFKFKPAMKQPVKKKKGLRVGTALTFRSGNSSRWAPYCWPSFPVNPERISAGSPIHSHSPDTPFQPRRPAYVAPFKRNGQSFLFSMLFARRLSKQWMRDHSRSGL